MTRLMKLAKVLGRYGTGAAAALILLAACAGHPEAGSAAAAPPGGEVEAAGQALGTDYDALYDELADA